MTHAPHSARNVDHVRCSVMTVSDTRTLETDTSGRLIVQLLERSGYEIRSYEIVPDDPPAIRARVLDHSADANVDAVFVTGGTGISQRDTTFEAVESLLDKRLDGFGELFRTLSYDQVGAAAMLSRAVAGVRADTAIFSMPGSTPAVELAMEKLILPQLGHIVALLSG